MKFDKSEKSGAKAGDDKNKTVIRVVIGAVLLVLISLPMILMALK